MSRPFAARLLAVLLLACALPAAAQDAVTITKAQKAVILMQSGRQYYGILLGLNDKEVKFQPRNLGVFTWKPSQVKAVQTLDRLLVYNADKQKFEPAVAPMAPGSTDTGNTPAVAPGPVPTKEMKGSGVTVEGVGTTPDAALKDAFRNAVQQVVGAVVDSETLVKNDTLIGDQILTYSDGFIRSHKKIREAERDGLHRVTITAEVERRSVVAKLKAVRIVTRDVDGESLFGEITSQLDAAKSAKALLDNAMKDYPFGCLEGVVLGKPEILERDEAKATFHVNLVFRANPQAYAVAVTRLQNTLQRIALEKGQFLLVYKPRAAGAAAVPGLFDPLERQDQWKKAMPRAFVDPEPKFAALALNLQVSPLKDRSAWSYYVLDEAVRESLITLALKEPRATLSFLDAAGETITTEQLSLTKLAPGETPPAKRARPAMRYNANPLSLMNYKGVIVDTASGARGLSRGKHVERLAHVDIENMRGASWFVFAPLFFERSAYTFTGTNRYLAQIAIAHPVTLSLAEVQRIRRIQCEIQFD